MTNKPIEVTICLGSSCFARGNNQNLEIIQAYFKEHNLAGKVDFRGHLCEEACKKGPTLKIADQVYYNVSPEKLGAILDGHFIDLQS